MALPSNLTTGLNKKQKEELEVEFRNCENVRRIVAKLLTKRIENAIIHEENGENFADPVFSHSCAFSAGYRKGLREALKLLTPKETNDRP